MMRSTLAALVALAAGAAVGRAAGRRPLLSALDEADAELLEFSEANAGMGEALTDIAHSLGMPLGRGGPPPWTATHIAQVAAFYPPDSIADDEIVNDICGDAMAATSALARYVESVAHIATSLGMPADSTLGEVVEFADRVGVNGNPHILVGPVSDEPPAVAEEGPDEFPEDGPQ